MPKMIQIRHVPDAVHRKLKTRAASKGMSLSDYLMLEINEIANLPTMDDWLDQLATREPVKLREPAAVTIRKIREGR
jgi:plasmid stability protein